MKIRDSAKSAMAQALLADMGAGTTGLPVFELHTSPMPSAIGDSVTSTVLARLEMSDDIATVSGGIMTFEPVSEAYGVSIGQIAWARALDRNGNEVMHLTAGVAGSGANVIVPEAEIVIGSPVSVSYASIGIG